MLADIVGGRLGRPVVVDNDVNVLALGEWMYGAGRGTRSLVVLALGTGVGGGIILDGRLHRGQGGHGELPVGHQAGQQQGHGQERGGDGPPNEELGDIHRRTARVAPVISIHCFADGCLAHGCPA